MSLRDVYEELKSQAVDPEGWGPANPLNPNRARNRQLSDEELIYRVRERNQANEPVRQLLDEIYARAQSEPGD